MTKCMIYNTTGEPLDLVPALLGLCLHLRGKAVILEIFPGQVVRSPRLEFPLPASVVLRKHRRVASREAALTNENLFLRDGYRCAYCGRRRGELRPRERLTRDHLIPRSKGGADAWLNVVTACSSCNHRKDDRLPDAIAPPAVRLWVPTHRDLVIRRLTRHGGAAA